MIIKSNFSDRIIFFGLFMSFSIIPLFNTFNWVISFVLLPLIFVYLIVKTKSLKFSLERFHKLFILLSLFSLASLIFVTSVPFYIIEIKRLFGVYIMISICFMYVKRNPSNIYSLYFILICKYIFMLIFTFKYGLDEINFEDRLNSGEIIGINANAFGYFAFISLFAAGIFTLLKKNILSISFFILIFLSAILITTIAASRAGLLFSFASFVLILNSIYYKKFSIRLAIILILCVYLLNNLMSNFDFESFSIFNRFTYFLESSEDQRLDIMREGIGFFLNKPFGNGGGQFEYLMLKSDFNKIAAAHNSFLLILVNYGIHGLLIFLILFSSCIRDSIKLIRSSDFSKNKFGVLFLSFFLLFFLYNMFYDFVLNLYVMLMFSTVYIHQRFILKNITPTIFTRK
jgi:O-antigen ligase